MSRLADNTGRRGAARLGAGLVVLLVAAVLLIGGRGRTYPVTVEFDATYGLIEGARVTAGGLSIGSVKKLALGRSGYPRAELSIDDDVTLRRGAVARVRPFSVSGEISRTVDLELGTGAPLARPAVIQRAQTQSVEEFDDVLSALDRGTRRQIGQVLEGFDAATHARGPDMERTLRRSAGALGATADLAAQLNADGAALRSLVSNGRRVVEAIGQSPGSLGAMAESVDGLMRTTAARQADLAIATTRAPRSLRSTRQTLDRLGASVDDLHGLMRDGRPAAAELRRIAPELRDLVIDAAPALARARELVGDGPADLQRLQPLLKAARPVLDTLVPILRDTLPMANQLRAHAPDWFSFWSGWGSYASPYDANGHGARVGLVLANPPRNVITPGSGAPGRLDPPFVRTPGALQSEPWRDYADSFLEGDK